MKKQIVSLILCLVLITSLFTGCGDNALTTVKKKAEIKQKSIDKAQAVVAISPEFVINGEQSVVAFNEIKNAIQNDRKAATLSSLENNTDFCCAYMTDGGWKKHGIYGLDKWINGRGKSIKTLNSYYFSEDYTDSLMAYTTKVADISAYGDGVPDYGIILSTSESREESLIYTVPQDGNLSLMSGNVIAVESIDGVKTGFLAEDGTKRSAIFRIDINEKRYFSGILANSTASEDGITSVSLDYPEIEDIPVKKGDMVLFSLHFNGEKIAADDITDSDNNVSEKPSYNGSSTKKPTEKSTDKSNDKQADPVTQIKFLNKFDPRFIITYSDSADGQTRILVSNLRKSFEVALNADQAMKSDGFDAKENEILIGETNRKESVSAYNDLREARTNYADDYIVRMDGGKLVVAAGSVYSLEKAIDLVKSYCVDSLSSVPSDLNVVYREEKSNLIIGGANIGSYVIRTEKYPSYMVKSAAKELQKSIVEKTGYMIQIGRETELSDYEILIGPNTRGTKQIAEINQYEINYQNKKLIINAGSTTAANTAVSALVAKLGSNISDGLSIKGSYKQGEYNLSGGYGLTWFDEFNGDWTKGDTVNRKNWTIMNDTTDGPFYKIAEVQDKINRNIGGPWLTKTTNGLEVDKGYIMEGYQTRPGVEGENFFLRDGKLVEVTKKSKTGYDAVRLYTSNLMRYRYGFTELRIKMATNNGACSAVWLSLNGNEIDLNENYGKDAYYSNIHTWTPEHVNHVAAGDMERTWVYPEKGSHFYDEYHYLGYEWTDSYIAFYLDGEITEMCDITNPKFAMFRKTTALKLANGVGTGTYSLGDNPGDYMGDDVNNFYEEQEIDFVRIYQKDSKKYKMYAK